MNLTNLLGEEEERGQEQGAIPGQQGVAEGVIHEGVIHEGVIHEGVIHEGVIQGKQEQQQQGVHEAGSNGSLSPTTKATLTSHAQKRPRLQDPAQDKGETRSATIHGTDIGPNQQTATAAPPPMSPTAEGQPTPQKRRSSAHQHYQQQQQHKHSGHTSVPAIFPDDGTGHQVESMVQCLADFFAKHISRSEAGNTGIPHLEVREKDQGGSLL